MSIVPAVTLGLVLIGKSDELETGVTGPPIAIAAVAVSLQLLVLVARSEARHVCVRTGGGTLASGRSTQQRGRSPA